MGRGMRNLALAAAPATAGFGLAIKEAASFEEQMSIVQSVLLASKDDMVGLEAVTKRLGATTAFTAKEAGEGAEFLARSGMSMQQIVDALPGVLDAAAAAGVTLGEAADTVAGQLGAFGLEASKATEVADTLSLTTALTNTNWTQLSEAMKFGAPIAKQAGLSLQDTATAMGVFANAGVKGSLAGTALKNALLKLAKPSKASIALFGDKEGLAKAVLQTVDGVTKLKPMEVVMANISKVVAKAKNPLEAAAMASEIFGLRGTTAFSSFQSQLTKTTTVTEKNIGQLLKGIVASGEKMEIGIGDVIPKMVALRLQIAGATGTAKEMAAIRLDNLKGQFTLFQSAVSGLKIEVGGLFTETFKDGLKVVTDWISGTVAAFQILNVTSRKDFFQLRNQMIEIFGAETATKVQSFVRGFVEGLDEVIETGKEVLVSIKGFFQGMFGDSEMTADSLGKMAAKFLAIAAIAAPVLGGIAALFFVLGPIISGVVGAVQFLWGALSILWGVASTVIPAIGTLISILGGPITLIIGAVIGVVAAFWFFRDEIADAAGAAWESIKQAFEPFAPFFKFTFQLGVMFFKKLGSFLLSYVDFWWNDIIKPIAGFYVWVYSKIFEGGKFAAGKLIEVFKPVVAWFQSIGETILDALTLPFRTMISLVKSVVSKIADTTIGAKALSLAGIDASELNASLANLPGVDVIDKLTGIKEGPITVADVAPTLVTDLLDETTRQKALTRPATAEETGTATVRAMRTGGVGTAGGRQQVDANVNVTVKGRIKGNDINLVTTKAQVEQAEKNGRQIPPMEKRRLIQNGAMALGTN
jgi:TP901 family phage tail tape measure protein